MTLLPVAERLHGTQRQEQPMEERTGRCCARGIGCLPARRYQVWCLSLPVGSSRCTLWQGKPYDDYFVSQLTELATNYGDIFCFWFDGACGEGKNGKKQIYDWERYYAVLRKLQPNAVLNVCGPDVRWCGNEAGHCRKQSGAWFPQSCGMQNARHRNRSRRMTENSPVNRLSRRGHRQQRGYPQCKRTCLVSVRGGYFHPNGLVLPSGGGH